MTAVYRYNSMFSWCLTGINSILLSEKWTQENRETDMEPFNVG